MHTAIGEEDIVELRDVDRGAAEHVGHRQRRVIDDRIGQGCIGVHLDGDKVGTGAPVLVLDRVDHRVQPGGLGRRDVDKGLVDDLRGGVRGVRRCRDHGQRAAIRIGVVGQHLHRHRPPGTHLDRVRIRHRVPGALEPRTDSDADGAGGSCSEAVNDRVRERIRSRGVVTRLVRDHAVGDREDRALLRVGGDPDQLHGVTVRIDPRERDRDVDGFPREHSGGHLSRDGRVVGGEIDFPHGDVHCCLRRLTVRPGDRVRGGVVARCLWRQISQLVAGGEKQASAVRQRLRQLGQQGDGFTIGL